MTGKVSSFALKYLYKVWKENYTILPSFSLPWTAVAIFLQLLQLSTLSIKKVCQQSHLCWPFISSLALFRSGLGAIIFAQLWLPFEHTYGLKITIMANLLNIFRGPSNLVSWGKELIIFFKWPSWTIFSCYIVSEPILCGRMAVFRAEVWRCLWPPRPSN